MLNSLVAIPQQYLRRGLCCSPPLAQVWLVLFVDVSGYNSTRHVNARGEANQRFLLFLVLRA